MVTDHEAHLTLPAGLDEPVRPAGRVGPHDHLGLGRIDRQLGQRIVQHGDVIGGGPRPGVTRAQQPGERFTGGVEIGQQRMEPEPTLVGRRRLFFLRVGVDQRGVKIDHVEPGVGTRRPRPTSRLGTSSLDPFQRRLIDRFQAAPHRGVGSHLTEQAWLVAQHRQIRDRLTAIGQHHRHVGQHPATIMTTTTLPGRRHRHRQRPAQPDRVSHISEQSRPDMIRHTRAATSDLQPRPPTITLHHGSALLVVGLGFSTNTSFPHQKGLYADTSTLNPGQLPNSLG